MARKNGRGNRNRQSKSPRNSNWNQTKNHPIGPMGDQGPIDNDPKKDQTFEDDDDEVNCDENACLLPETSQMNGVCDGDSSTSSSEHQHQQQTASCEDYSTETTGMSSFNPQDIDLSEEDDNDDSSVVNNGDIPEFMETDEMEIPETPFYTDDSVPRGILNHGNTCFINASLQALYAIPALRQYFSNCYFRRLRQQSNTGIIDHLEQFFHQKLYPQTFDGETVSKTISISLVQNIWHEFKLRRLQQQDAQEFLKYLFNYIHEEVKYIDTRSDDLNSQCLVRQNRPLFAEVLELITMKQKQNRKYNQRLHQFYSLSSQVNIPSVNSATVKPVSMPVKYRSIISDLFSGKLKNTVHCLNCNNYSSRLETFQDLSIPISILVKSNTSSSSSSKQSSQASKLSKQNKSIFKSLYDFVRSGSVLNIFEWLLAYIALVFVLMEYSLTLITAGNYRLEDCLSRFFSQEVLSGDNMYQCDKCNKLTDCVKQLKIQSLPDILTIHLNRYQNTSGNIHKLTSCIEFPITGLDTSHFLSDDCVTESTLYDLVAVIAHSGAFMNSGHYVCYALNEYDQEWYLYDDCRVMRISTESLLDEMSSVAYILFYRKSILTTDDVNMDESISTTQAAREVCLDLEKIHCQLDPDINKSYDLIQEHFIFNQYKWACLKNGRPSVFVNRDAVYLPKYWLNLFVNTENPGLFNNYEAFCHHGNVRQTEWLFFNRLVNKVIKPVGVLLYNLYADINCPCELPPASQLAVCQTCLSTLFQNEMLCQQQSHVLDTFRDNQEFIQPTTFLSGTIEITFDQSEEKTDSEDHFNRPNGTMSGDLVSINNHDNVGKKAPEKYYIIPYEWFIHFRAFTFFEQFGKCNCASDYLQISSQLDRALTIEGPDKLERLVPYTFKTAANIVKLPFLPLSAIIRGSQRFLRNCPSFSTDKVRNESALKTLYASILKQIDFNTHFMKKPRRIDNFTVFGIRDRIIEFCEKNMKNLPNIDGTSESLILLGKIIRTALIDDAYGYHFQADSACNMAFDKELQYYTVVVSETVWNSFKDTFGANFELSTGQDFVEQQNFTFKLDQNAINQFYEMHYKPWWTQQIQKSSSRS